MVVRAVQAAAGVPAKRAVQAIPERLDAIVAVTMAVLADEAGTAVTEESGDSAELEV
jgi:acyl-CoA synthetase (NDP forming)